MCQKRLANTRLVVSSVYVDVCSSKSSSLLSQGIGDLENSSEHPPTVGLFADADASELEKFLALCMDFRSERVTNDLQHKVPTRCAALLIPY
jgi:hypothetical protein